MLDIERGLDHGVWVPLRILFPQADVPVVPLAMPWPLDVGGAFRLGQALSVLADEGVLLPAAAVLGLGDCRGAVQPRYWQGGVHYAVLSVDAWTFGA